MSDRRLLIGCISSSVAGILLSAFLHSKWSIPNIYSDIASFWGRPFLQAGSFPYDPQNPLFEYPPVSGLILYAARIVGGNYSGYYLAFSTFSILAAVVIAWSSWRLAGDLGVRLNPLYFLLPSMIVYGVYNFDLFNAMFILLTLQMFVEKRRDSSAVFLGIAIATKFIAGVLFPIFLIGLVGWGQRVRFLVIAGIASAVFFVPLVLYNPGYVAQLYNFLQGWGLEDAWYIWIFGDPFSRTAKLFGLILLIILLVRVYTLKKMPLVQWSFLALTAYLLSTYIYSPQFNVMLIPIVAVLAMSTSALYFWDVFNALIILTWFTVSNPTEAGTVPQVMALLRSAALALMGLSVASGSGHSLVGWIRKKTGLKLGAQPLLTD